MIRARTMGMLIALLAIVACKSSNGAEVVGDQCLPDKLPSGPQGEGFFPTDSYAKQSAACEGYPCIVHRLANTGDAGALSDPNKLCDGSGSSPGCVTPAALENSVHCSCPCRGPGDPDKYCVCPKGFTCRELATLRDDGLRDAPLSYCVKPQALNGQPF